MNETVPLDALSVFVAVAEASSFSIAAKKLGMPKSSVSRRIAGLEKDLGVRLVLRTTRSVSLSTAGTALYERVAPHLAALVQSIGEIPEREEEPSGELRVTAPVDLGSTFLAGVVTKFLARHPRVRIHALVTNRVLDLVRERVDVALRVSSGPMRDSSLVARKASALAGHLYASPSYLARRGTPRTPQDLEAHEWIGFGGFPSSLRIFAPGDERTLRPKGRLSSDDLFFVRAAVLSGAGIGFLPTFLADAAVASGDLVLVLPRHTAHTGTLYLVLPAGKPPRKVSAFCDFVLETLRARPLA